MGHVFGDSTPFPYDVNFIELIRHAVECGVELCKAQHNIASAADRRASVDQLRRAERLLTKHLPRTGSVSRGLLLDAVRFGGRARDDLH